MAKYLYNGIELPDINTVWTDKETYKYAYIGSNDDSRYILYLSSLPFYIWLRGYAATLDTAQGQAFVADKVNGVWQQETDITQFTNESMTAYPKWTNHDIYYTDDYATDETLAGTLYLPASDPVPVSPYLPKNGAWVKHDVYKQVGNSWVKQPQGAVEVEGGAWSALS